MNRDRGLWCTFWEPEGDCALLFLFRLPLRPSFLSLSRAFPTPASSCAQNLVINQSSVIWPTGVFLRDHFSHTPAEVLRTELDWIPAAPFLNFT